MVDNEMVTISLLLSITIFMIGFILTVAVDSYNCGDFCGCGMLLIAFGVGQFVGTALVTQVD